MNEFACEGIEQVNKWFYCSAVLCALLFNKPFCHNIMCSGLVLAEDGTKCINIKEIMIPLKF